MIKVASFSEVLGRHCALSGKVMVDVGCGTGDLVRWAAAKGAKVVGVDSAAMIARAKREKRAGAEAYMIGTAEDLAFECGTCDLLTYVASFHHVPPSRMPGALERCRDVLKPGGAAAFLEPLSRKGSYYDIVRFVEEETEMRAQAARVLKGARAMGFVPMVEETYYVERSYADFLGLIAVFVDDAARRAELAAAAHEATERRARRSGKSLGDVRYKSICRLNILRKPA